MNKSYSESFESTVDDLPGVVVGGHKASRQQVAKFDWLEIRATPRA